MSREKVLVTGATGLVGNAVARALLNRGDEVIAIDRLTGSIEGVDVTMCDLNDIHQLHAVTGRGLTGVVHCGAFSGPMVARDNPYAMVQVNIVGTANVLDRARIYQARRFVFCSSTSAYGHTKRGPVQEETYMAPESLYGASIRLSWVYGPRRTTDCVIRDMLTHARAGRPMRLPFGADFFRQFIHVDDAGAALLKAFDAPELPRRIYNATGGTRVTLQDIAAIVKDIYPMADIELAKGPDPLDEFQEAFDISAAHRDLHFVPQIGLAEGIRNYARWLEETHKN